MSVGARSNSRIEAVYNGWRGASTIAGRLMFDLMVCGIMSMVYWCYWLMDGLWQRDTKCTLDDFSS